MRDVAVGAIDSSVSELLARRERLVVAASGGIDSSVLLDAVLRLRTPAHHIVVASVDHGTGDAATEATARAVAAAARHGVPAISERLSLGRHDEATLRAGRWSFLKRVGAAQDATVVTAHTRDDHIETVVMRAMRGAGARGLAGLLAPSLVERPLLAHRRKAIRAYAAQHSVHFTEDPSNESLAFFRNRVRLQLLPAIRRVAPDFEEEMFELSRRAADLRAEVDSIASLFELETRTSQVVIDATALGDLPDDSVRLLLPSLLGRAGITLDRRGLVRLASVVRSTPGSRGQLSGGYESIRSRSEVTVLKPSSGDAGVLRLRESGETRFGDFRFRAEPGANIPQGAEGSTNPWRISIPKSAQPVVRQWHPGDRLTTDLMGGRRRVKRFFSDAGVVGPLRAGWPVVLCNDDVVWIPGIKTSQAAIPDEARMVHYICEKIRD
jgi:tRNA(Ile)-lysidine synthase